jgi:hypothetical protein
MVSGLLLALVAFPLAAVPRLDRITLPPGFSITVFAAQVPGARSMTLGTQGTLFVGTVGEGAVYAIPDAASGPVEGTCWGTTCHRMS